MRRARATVQLNTQNSPLEHVGFIRTLPRKATVYSRYLSLPNRLYFTHQTLVGAYASLINSPLPDPNSPDYHLALLYQARAHIALGDSASALKLIPEDTEDEVLRAAISLAQYIGATDEATKDSSLEELRDLSVEIEGDDFTGSERDKALVRVLAGTAFARAGEVEEALETLGTDTEDLEASVHSIPICVDLTISYSVSVIVQIYLSINRPDLAKKEFERSKRWAEDDLLLKLIESTIGLVTGKDNYSNTSSFYTEQIGNPSLTSPHLLTARGVTRILRNEVQEARSDLEEALEQHGGDAETQAALVVAAGLGATKKPEADEIWRLVDSVFINHIPADGSAV